VRMKVADEPQLEAALVEAALEVEQERLDTQLGPAKRRAVSHRKGGHGIPCRGFGTARVCAKGRHELVRLDADVGRREAQSPADPIPGLDRPGHGVLTTEELVCLLDLACRDEAPDLGAVQLAAVDPVRRGDLDVVAVAPQPVRIAGPAPAESEVES